MLYLENFANYSQAPTIHVNHANKVFVVNNVAYDFNMNRLGVLENFSLNEDLSLNSLWNGVKGAANWLKDSMWSSIAPPMDAKLTDPKGLLEWGHYILGLSSLVLGLSGVGALVATAIDMIDGAINFIEGTVKKIKFKDETFEPYTSLISGAITIGSSLMGGRAASGPILKTIKAESKEIAGKIAAGKLSKDAAVSALLGKNNRAKTFQTFAEQLQSQSLKKKIQVAFGNFINFIKEIPVVSKCIEFVKGFVTNVIFWITEGAKKVGEWFHSILSAKKPAAKPVPAKSAAKPVPANQNNKPAVAKPAAKPVPAKPAVAKPVPAKPVAKPVKQVKTVPVKK